MITALAWRRGTCAVWALLALSSVFTVDNRGLRLLALLTTVVLALTAMKPDATRRDVGPMAGAAVGAWFLTGVLLSALVLVPLPYNPRAPHPKSTRRRGTVKNV